MDFDKGIIFAEYKLTPFRPIRTRFRVLVAHDLIELSFDGDLKNRGPV